MTENTFEDQNYIDEGGIKGIVTSLGGTAKLVKIGVCIAAAILLIVLVMKGRK